jgi:hypothetical protein
MQMQRHADAFRARHLAIALNLHLRVAVAGPTTARYGKQLGEFAAGPARLEQRRTLSGYRFRFTERNKSGLVEVNRCAYEKRNVRGDTSGGCGSILWAWASASSAARRTGNSGADEFFDPGGSRF